MDLKPIAHDLVECIDQEKLAALLVDKIVFASLKKVVEDSSNPFDDSAYAMLAPLIEPKAKEAIIELFAKLKA